MPVFLQVAPSPQSWASISYPLPPHRLTSLLPPLTLSQWGQESNQTGSPLCAQCQAYPCPHTHPLTLPCVIVRKSLSPPLLRMGPGPSSLLEDSPTDLLPINSGLLLSLLLVSPHLTWAHRLKHHPHSDYSLVSVFSLGHLF